jgi:hypothetical protein
MSSVEVARLWGGLFTASHDATSDPVVFQSRDDPQDLTTTNTYEWKYADFDGHHSVLVELEHEDLSRILETSKPLVGL